MLALTRKTDYALIALSYLVGQRLDGGKPVSAKRIADTFGLPLPLLMNILKQLVQAKVLTSTRGPRGGYGLAVEPADLTLLEVINALEGPIRLTPCIEGAVKNNGQGCHLSTGCPIKGTVKSLHNRIHHFLEELTLQDLYDERLPAGDSSQPQATPTHYACGCSDAPTLTTIADPETDGLISQGA